jgi:NADH:ubiquinone oxidoreductase subunit 4 (subunit M)
VRNDASVVGRSRSAASSVPAPARWLAGFFLGCALLWPLGLLLPRVAHAEPRLTVIAPKRPLELVQTAEGLAATFVVKNTGDRALEPRVTLLSSPNDPRTPAGVSVTSDRGKLSPGQERTIRVRFVPPNPDPDGPAPSRARELWGVLQIDGAGAPSETLGLHGNRTTGGGLALARWTLPLLVLVPLLAALISQILQRIRPDERHPRRVALAAFVLDALLALALLARFDRGMGRLDGNDGFQFVSRTTLSKPLGIELACGVDGSSIGLLVALTLGATALAALGERVVLRTTRTWTAMLVSVAGLLSVVVSLDLAVTVIGWAVALFAAAALRANHAPRGSSLPGRRLALIALVSTACFALFAIYAVSFVGHGFVFDGTLVPQSFAHGDLVRASFPSVTRTLLGLPFVAGLFLLLLGAVAPVLGLFPLDGFVHDAFEGSESPTIAIAFLPAVAAFVLLRWGALVVPEAMTWASTSLAIWAAIAALLGALSALRETRLSALLGVAVSTQAALGVVGLASATPQGVLGATTLFSSTPLTISLIGGACVLLAGRVGTDDLAKLGGIAREAKLLGFALIVGGLGVLAWPLSVSGWGAGLVLVGSTARLPIAAALVALALLALSGQTLARLASALFGAMPTALRATSALEPFGGHLPELSRRERAVLLPLSFVVLGLGISPRPLLGLAERASLDVAAFLDEPGPTQIALLDRALRSVSPRAHRAAEQFPNAVDADADIVATP